MTEQRDYLQASQTAVAQAEHMLQPSGFASKPNPLRLREMCYWLAFTVEFVTLNGYPGGPFT